jgi:acyl-CoA synthetase (AMP-forming)/AMP-acid ligase II/NADP-dependent 3-hydroxy acid dehydrogenase YdfG
MATKAASDCASDRGALLRTERELLADPRVADCVVRARDAAGGPRAVAYIVPGDDGGTRDSIAHFASLVPGGVLVALVSSIPTTASGEVDERALESVPVIDRESLENLARGAAALGADASVSSRARHVPPAVLDLRKLLRPRKRAAPAAASQPDLRIESDRASVVHGEPFAGPWPERVSLAETLVSAARRHPDEGLTFVRHAEPDLVLTYPQLLLRAQRVLAGLRKRGLRSGDKILFQLDDNRDFIVAFWGAVLGGFVPVPLAVAPSYTEGSAAVTKLRYACELFDRPLVLGGTALVPVIEAALRAAGVEGVRVLDVETLLEDPDTSIHGASSDDTALIMLTSGSTGVPKAVPLSHFNLVWRAAASRQMNGFSDEDVSLNWMALDHVAGIIYFHLRDVFLGAAQVHAPTSLVLQDPLNWLTWIERYRATVTFAPNFAFGLVNDCAERIAAGRWDLSSLRLVLNGAEAIVSRTARRFLSLLAPHGLRPNAMRPAWGMSETSSGVIYSDRFSLATTTDEDAFVEVGRPIPGVSIRIVNDAAQPVPEGTIGRLQITGNTVFKGYFKRPDLNSAAFTADGWFDTGDLGVVRDGRLTITGREKDDIVIAGVKYYSHEVESVVEEVGCALTSFTAACPVRPEGADTEALAVFFVPMDTDPESLARSAADIRRAVGRKVGVAPEYVVPVGKDDIPKTSLGKIQRTELRKRFEAGDFAAELARLGVDRDAAIPAWFYRATWRRRPLRASERGSLPSAVVLVDDGSAVAAALSAQLAAAGTEVRAVQPEAALSARAAEVARLASELEPAASSVIYLSGEAARADLAACTEARAAELLALVRALAERSRQAPARLLVVSRNARAVLDGDGIDPSAQAMAALVKTAALEGPAVRATQVDVDGGDPERAVRAIVEELGSRSSEPDVAYRGGQRWVSRLERAVVDRTDAAPQPLEQGGLYVLVGGLGGIGFEVARFLRAEHDARLLLIGRQPLEAARGDGVTGAQLLEQLQGEGREAQYEQVDVTDSRGLRAAMAAAERRFGRPVRGVLNLAGTFAERLLLDETESSLAAVLGAKVRGAVALHEALGDRPDAALISFSSVTGYFGGFAVGAYSAANAFLDAFAAWQRARGRPSYSLAWSLWEKVGMSRTYRLGDRARAKGHLPVSAAAGIASLRLALAQDEAALLIGLDGAAPAVRRWLASPCEPLLEPVVSVRGGGREARAALASLRLVDPFGTSMPCVVAELRSAPPEAAASGAEQAPKVAPRTDMERRIAAIWQDVLRTDAVDVLANFFDVGGTSLLMAQVYRRLKEDVGTDLSMTDLFAAPTISTLAARLSGDAPNAEGTAAERQRGEERREKARRMKGRGTTRPLTP